MKIQTFPALRHRNYRLFFYGQSISLIGTWLERTALSWLVYRLTDSPLLLGVVGFSGQISTFLLAPFAGVIADRHHRHRLLLITQILAMIQAFIVSILVLTRTIQIWEIITLSIALGMINGFDIPIRQSFTSDMIDNPDDLGNAIALNSSIVNAARLIGPSIAGFLIATVGEGICFLLNALSFICVVVSLLKMRVPVKEKRGSGPAQVWLDLKEGFQYTFGFFPMRTILLLLSFVSLVGGGLQTLMPVFARDIFHGGAPMLGLLMGSSGLGSLIGAIYLVRRKNVLGLGKVMVAACCLLGAGMIGFVLTPSLWFSLLMLVVCGFGMIVQMSSSNMVLQSMVEENKRGRVMSFYLMAFMGMAPFGSLIAGGLAHKIHVSTLFIISGVCVIVAGALFSLQLPRLRKLVRPIYIQKGIITEMLE